MEMRHTARMILDIRNNYSIYSLTVMYTCDRNTYYYWRIPCHITILIPCCTGFSRPNYLWWFVVIQEFRRCGCRDSRQVVLVHSASANGLQGPELLGQLWWTVVLGESISTIVDLCNGREYAWGKRVGE